MELSLSKSTGPSKPEPYLQFSLKFVRIQVISLSDAVVPSSLGTSVSDQQRGGQSRGQIDNVVHEREQMGEALKFTQGCGVEGNQMTTTLTSIVFRS